MHKRVLELEQKKNFIIYSIEILTHQCRYEDSLIRVKKSIKQQCWFLQRVQYRDKW